MLPLFDMMANAQNGQGMDLLARQFGLSQQQTQLAVEALMPAFSQGLQRNAADPYGIANFMTALASGQQGKYFDDTQAAFYAQGVAEGNGILGQLFGSKELSRAITAQAAQATGIGQSVLNQMLPVLASMVMGGLFKQSTNQMQEAQAGGFGSANNPLGQIIEQMMKQGGGGMFGGQPQQQQAPSNPMENPLGKILEGMFGGGAAQQPRGTQQQPPSSPMDNPFGKMLEDMLGGSQQQPQAQPQPDNPMGDNPWGEIFEDMMRGGQAQTPAEQDEEPAPAPRTPSGRPANPYDDIFGKMFESGSKTRDDYQKGVESIFDQFTRGMDRNR
jgi:hypothetical protein